MPKRNDRDYGLYIEETTVIETFENFEEGNMMDYGTEQEDFMPWFICFRAGFLAGGNS